MKKLSMSMFVAEQCPMDYLGYSNQDKADQQLSVEKNLRFASVLNRLGYTAINLSGSDPLYRSDIRQIIEGIDELDLEINLETTGRTFLNHESEQNFSIQEVVKTVDIIGIPLDGDSDEMIRVFRAEGASTLFETRKILEKLEYESCRTKINTMVHSENIDDLDKIYKLITKYPNIIQWDLHQFTGFVEELEVNKSFDVSDADFKHAVDDIRNAKNIVINPESRQNKCNTSYLDFNGDYIRVIDGNKRIMFNIKNMDEAQILRSILSLTETTIFSR